MTPHNIVVRDLEPVLERVAQAAPSRDAKPDAGLGEEVEWLHATGALSGALPRSLTGRSGWSDDTMAVAEVLRAVGRASLPLGRLFEGHINAAQLIGLYGEPALRARCAAAVHEGRMLGIWGADGPSPVDAGRAPGGFRLQGAKIFCSGLGVVYMAVVSATFEGAVSLFAVEVADSARADRSNWRVSGMRATQSGGYDFRDVLVPSDALMGRPGDLYVEPYFLGGMYRICAVQAGGLEALLAALIASLCRRPRGSELLSQHRIGAVASRASAAVAVTERLARILAVSKEAAFISREAILGREAVERCAVEALEIVERSVGTEAHREETRISLIRRDLSFYLRQAIVDERLAEAGRSLMTASEPI